MPTCVADDKLENTSELENTVSGLPTKDSHTSKDGASDDSATPRVHYEGYKFFKADPIPGERPTWTKVERMEMYMSESELCKKVQKRANKVSAAQQYQNLSEACQAHVNQLIHEKRQSHTRADWSCVYAKERKKPSKARNIRPDDYEIVYMQVILMQRPLQTTSYPRTPMGDLVNLEPQFGVFIRQEEPGRVEESQKVVNRDFEPQTSQLRHRSLPPYRRPHKGQPWGLGRRTKGDEPIIDLLTRPFTANTTREIRETDYDKELWDVNEKKATMQSKYSSKQNVSADSFESDVAQDENATAYHVASNGSSTVGSPSKKACLCQGPPILQPSFMHARGLNMNHWEFDPRYTREGVKIDRDIVRRSLSDGTSYTRMDAIHATSTLPVKRSGAISSEYPDATCWRKKICIQRMDGEEMRSRLLDCEARIQQWEKTLHDQTRILQMTIRSSPGSRYCQ